MFRSSYAHTISRAPTTAWLLPLLALAVLAGVGLPAELYLLALAAAVAAAGACLFYLTRFQRRVNLGFSLLVVTSVLVPYSVGSGNTSNIGVPLILVALLMAAWITDMAIRRQIPSLQSRPVVALLLFLAVTIGSFVAGQYPWFPSSKAPLPAQLAGLAIFLLSGCAFLLFAYLIPNLRQLKLLTWIFLLTGAVITFIRAFPSLDQSLAAFTKPGTIGSMFWTWLVALSFGQAVLNRHLSWFARGALLLLAGFVLAVALFQYGSWASGWLPPLCAIAVIIALRFPRLCLSAGFIAVPLILMHQGSVTESLLSTEQYSADSRVAAWTAMFRMIETSPILGFGPANYYHYTALFPIWGWYVRFNSHNNYIDIVAQTGLLGLLLFAWFVFEIARLAWTMRRQAAPGFVRAYVYSVIGGLVATVAAGMLGDWVLPFVYNVGMGGFRSSVLPWIFLGGLFAVFRLTKDRVNGTASRVPGAPDGA